MRILTESHLAENLGITADEGLSWNLKAALRIACLDAVELRGWHEVYQEELFARQQGLLADFVEFLRQQLAQSLDKMRALLAATTEGLGIAVELVASQLAILEKTLADLT